jgi:integrase
MLSENELTQKIRPFTRINKKTGKIYNRYRKKIVFKTPDGGKETKEFFGKTPEEVARQIIEYQETLNGFAPVAKNLVFEDKINEISQNINKSVRTNKKTGKVYETYRKKVTFKLPNGINEIKTFNGKTPEEVAKKIVKFQENLYKGLSSDHDVKTLSVCMEEWLWNTVKNEVRNATFDMYYTAFRLHFKKMKISNITVNELKTTALQKEFNEMFEKGLTRVQIGKVRALLNKFYNYAISQDWALKNPCAGTNIPASPEDAERENQPLNIAPLVFSDEELDRIFKSTEGKNTGRYMYAILRVAFTTGMRIGEILGLSFENVDLDKKRIYVRKSLKHQRIYEKDGTWRYSHALGATKTKSSVRDVPITESLLNVLREYIEREEALYAEAGKTITPETLLFTTENFKYLEYDSVRRAWTRILKRAGVRQEKEGDSKRRRLHNARHTFGSNLCNNGINMQTTASLMGHGSTKTTEIYTHSTFEDMADAMEKTDLFARKTFRT